MESCVFRLTVRLPGRRLWTMCSVVPLSSCPASIACPRISPCPWLICFCTASFPRLLQRLIFQTMSSCGTTESSPFEPLLITCFVIRLFKYVSFHYFCSASLLSLPKFYVIREINKVDFFHSGRRNFTLQNERFDISSIFYSSPNLQNYSTFFRKIPSHAVHARLDAASADLLLSESGKDQI